MASLRNGKRRDGSSYVQVLYRLNGKQSSTSFEDLVSATRFKALVDRFGAAKALETLGADPEFSALTVGEWIQHHVDHLTGLRKSTLYDYRSYLKNDIADSIGDLPLFSLTRDDIARWVQSMARSGASGKTIANKHGFLSSALNAAVRAGRLPANPAAGQRLPSSARQEMTCLTREDFDLLLSNVSEYWRPLVEFLVASGCRWGEATALRPADVDHVSNTVRINKAWKRTYDVGGYEIGPPKTRNSVRTINLPNSVLDKLDYTGEWLFLNKAGRPVKGNGFHDRIWQPAVERSWPTVDEQGNPVANKSGVPRPRIHDLRHTCASWMIQAGVPLPVIQRHLGHESIHTTVSVYGHLDRRSMQMASDAIAQMLGGEESAPSSASL
jgi:integrase